MASRIYSIVLKDKVNALNTEKGELNGVCFVCTREAIQ